MALPQDKLKKLIDLMNSKSNVSCPVPMHPNIIELFDLAMDEQTMDFLLAVGADVCTVPQLEERYHQLYGGDAAAWNEFWQEKIIAMSFMHPISNGERDLYEVTPIFPGWIEFYTAGPTDEKRSAILNKFVEFWQFNKLMNMPAMRAAADGKVLQAMAAGVPPRVTTYMSRGREITLNQPMTSQQQVLTKGDVYALLEKNHDDIAVGNCFCRQYKRINDKPSCEFGLPVEGCIVLGAIAEQLVNNGVARKLTLEEACAMVDEFQRKGAVHTTYHYANDCNKEEIVICNCCPDCCLMYSFYREAGLSKVYNRSFYSPRMVDESRCVGCNLCGKYCPTEAVYYDKEAKKLVFDYDKCIGCGQCVNQCKFGVREMVADERDVYVKTKAPATEAVK